MDDGLGGPDLLVLDPACGPGVFLLAVLRHLARSTSGTSPRLLGFDADASAIATARRLLVPLAERLGVSLSFRAIDTLAVDPRRMAERHGARHLLVLGNPPWASGHRLPSGSPLTALMEDFKRDTTGRPLRHRRLGAVRDACIHFWRWGAEAARTASGWGAVSFLSNGAFLDGAVHEGVRARLLQWFDRLHVVDLGGGGLVARDGTKDAPLMAVRTPPAAVLARRDIRGPTSTPSPRNATVSFASVRGSRAAKWRQLAEGPPARLLTPHPPHFWLKPRPGEARWPRGWVSLSALFPFHREGVQTNRDRFVTDSNRDALLERLVHWLHGRPVAPAFAASLRLRPHFDPDVARKRLAEAASRHPDGLAGLLEPLAYRPGVRRWWLPVAPLTHRPRPALCRAVRRARGALLTVGHDRGERPWRHFGWSSCVADGCWHSSRSSCRTRVFPTHRPDGEPNLDAERLATWAAHVNVCAPIDAFHYALAVLSSPDYQQRYAGLLRTGAIHLPPPPDERVWRRVHLAGRHLAQAFERLDAGEAAPSRPLHIGHRRLNAPESLHHALCEAAEAVASLPIER